MITSKSNELIKYCNQIKQKKYSKEYGMCLVESIKLVKELSSKHLIQSILVIESKFDLVKDLSLKIEIISDSIASYLSDATTTDGVFGICKISCKKDINFKKCLILDRIQDPANIGAIVRSACAFGFDTIFAIDTVYPYTFKGIRSSMGYIFNVNYLDIDFDDLIKIKDNNNLDIVIADMNGKDISTVAKSNRNIAIVIGNEGRGVSDELKGISNTIVSIPMCNNVDSLNASVSAGIIMYCLK